MAYYVFVAIRAVHSFHLDWNVEYSNYIVLNGPYPLPNGIDPSIKELLPEGHGAGLAFFLSAQRKTCPRKFVKIYLYQP